MAELKYCPACECQSEVTKKGFNKDNEQLWICKKCGKKFVAITAPKKSAAKRVAAMKTPVKKAAAPKAKVVTPKTKKVTEIIVNNNTIKTVPNELTINQAFDMVSSYFKEIAKEKATITTVGDKTVITFKITAGSKG